MKRVLQGISILIGLPIITQVSFGAIPNTDDPSTFLGPILKGSYSDSINEDFAYSVLGEAGIKNYRANGTLGAKIDAVNRVKLSGEYLRQKINYAFFSGNSKEWVEQAALGANFQHDLGRSYYSAQLEVGAYVSHAPNKNLSTVTGQYIDQGAVVVFSDPRRIAGSNAAGVAPGVSFRPWPTAKTGFALNYDSVQYDTTSPYNQDAIGLGGTFTFNQALTDSLMLGLTAAVRQPFNNYQANLTWAKIPQLESWAFGIDGAYTVGKNTLPSTYNVGLNIRYVGSDVSDQDSSRDRRFALRGSSSEFVQWTAEPAIYLPQVLAIVDKRVTLGCTAIPVLIGSLDTVFVSGIIPPINTAAVFSGANLHYSITVTPPLTGGSVITIDATTGVITGNVTTDGYAVVVTATNSCGSVSSNSFSIVFD